MPARQLRIAQILRDGLGSQTQLHSVPALSAESMSAEHLSIHSGGSERIPGNWISQEFRQNIFISDLDLPSEGSKEDPINEMDCLKNFLNYGENEKCTLNFRAMHKDRFTLESGKTCHGSLSVCCDGKDQLNQQCSHRALYKYAAIPSGGRFDVKNKNCPIFQLVVPRSGRLVVGHSCNESKAADSVGNGKQGRESIPKEQIQVAIFLLNSALSLRTIVEAFGADPSNYSKFQMTMIQFRNAISHRLKGDCVDDMETLISYFKKCSEIGHNAFSCIERVPGSNIPRIFWMSAEQILFLKEGRATALSLDFVYKLIPGVGLGFGHLTAMSPSGHLVPVAQFLCKSESSDAIEWVFEKYNQVHQTFGLTCQSPVSFFLC